MAKSTAMAAGDDSHAMMSLQSHLGDEDVHRSGAFTGVYAFHRRQIRNGPRSPAIIQRADPGTVGNEEVKNKTEDSRKVMSFQVEKMVEDASEYRGTEVSSQDWAERGDCGRRAGPGFSRLSSAN
ncbi:unnamed protein product [Rangifer tarandus platyrhynchus]|uniref:Uncharacterized protein n=1 Tax=Rangifer tarandus platyrhynchus TaxID=3082113 RepID=A0ACB1MJR8_RANTA